MVTFHDISNPRHPRRLSVFRPPASVVEGAADEGFGDSVHDPKIRGNRAYFSWYKVGVVVADISDPRHPRFLGRFHPPASPDPEATFCPNGRCSTVWGVYPVGNVVYASDMVGGLWVVRVR
jgi:hypothetical protein